VYYRFGLHMYCITTRNIIGVNLHVSGSSAVRPGLFNVNVHLDENLCI